MSDLGPNLDRLFDLMASVCDDDASGGEVAELEAHAIADQESCRRFLGYCRMHSTLRLEFRARRVTQTVYRQIELESVEPMAGGWDGFGERVPTSAFVTSAAAPVGRFSWDWPVAYLVATVVCLIGICVSSRLYVSDLQIAGSLPKDAAPAVDVKTEFVGEITATVGLVWDGTRRVSLGQKLTLVSGLMEITYNNGAKVILQGPVEYKVDSPVGGYLSVGKLTGNVATASAKGFLVRTPIATVTDLGTEFGVEVRESGTSCVHVFHGTVEFQSTEPGGRLDQAVRLTENESAQMEKGNGSRRPTVCRGIADPAAFVRSVQFSKLAKEQEPKPFRRWQTFREELRKVSSLLAYYDFQQRAGEPSVLPNVAANGDTSLDGVVEQATWTNGRMPGKHALLLQNQEDYVRLNLPQKVDELTLVAWINITSLQSGASNGKKAFNGLLMSESWIRPGQMHWQIDSNGCICLSQVGINNGQGLREWKSSPTFGRAHLRCWTHIATVIDRASRVRFYVNGQLKGNVAPGDPEHVPICIGPSRIGTWDCEPRIFNGRIDELAIFGRALGADEVRRLFEGGDPTGGKKLEPQTLHKPSTN